MKLASIALAGALALTSTFAFAQTGGANGEGATMPKKPGTMSNGQGGAAGKGSMEHRTTGTATHRIDSGNPNGDPGGPTSLSGTGSSQFGGSVAGSTGKN